MNQLKLISDIPPSVNHYMAYRAIIKSGRPMAVPYVTTDAATYKKKFSSYVENEVKNQGWDVECNKSRHFYVDATFYFPRVRMDANNYFKIMLDAITDTKLIWLDDNVVCERVQAVYYDNKNPRIELLIHPVDYIGVFEDSSQRDKFINRCIGCVRYARNCNLLKKALEGRIQEEIQDYNCCEYKAIHQPK